jgi:hypothetical protein
MQPTSRQARVQRAGAQFVMHQFARSEVRSLDANEDAFYEQVRDRLWKLPEFKRSSFDEMDNVIGRLTARLQEADLTINFDATKWFSTPNEYKSYFQMYASRVYVEKDAGGNTELRMPADKLGTLNPTGVRARADETVTFGANITSPDRSGIARLMRTGKVAMPPDPAKKGAKKNYFTIENGQFNQHARQIFAALNYGRRPGGSSTAYGKSVLILKAALKRNAIFYMGDTFDLDASHRLTYGTLAGAFLHAPDDVLTDLLDSCFRVVPLKNTEDAHRLLEAHIFEPVTFAHDVARIRIARSEATEAVLANAKAFKRKNNIRIWVVDSDSTAWNNEQKELAG